MLLRRGRRHALITPLGTVLLVLLATFVVSPAPAHAAKSRHTRIHEALKIAKNQRGDPYRYGAEGPRRFDCSGLVYFSTHRAGFTNVPRTSSAQSRFMRHIKKAHLRPGDFMFFTSRSGVYHVGVFVGRSGGRALLLHAPSTGKRVRVDPVWTGRWFAATLRR